MLKLFLTCSFCLTTCSIASTELETKVFLAVNPKLSDECKLKVQSELDKCKQDSLDKWNSTLVKMDLQKASCCSSWQYYDCLQASVKSQCANKELKDVQDQSTKQIRLLEVQGFCAQFHYYSTKCTISEKEILDTATQDEKNKLITDLPPSSQKCQDETHKRKDSCFDKIAKQTGYSNDDIKNNKNKVECCRMTMIADCMLDMAKKSKHCSHQDVNGLILIFDNENTNKAENDCKDIEEYGAKCTNDSNNHGVNNMFILIAISILLLLL